MAKGKQATLAANRRAESAHEVIDRLTSELTKAKIRARDAEARAEHLEGIDKHLADSSTKNDELVVAMVEKLAWWDKAAKADRRRRIDARAELHRRLVPDIISTILGQDACIEDARQFISRRYPALMATLCAIEQEQLKSDEPVEVRSTSLTPAMQRLSGDRLRKLQRLCGLRGVMADHPDKDVAVIVCDLLDAQQAKFTLAETLEYALDGAA